MEAASAFSERAQSTKGAGLGRSAPASAPASTGTSALSAGGSRSPSLRSRERASSIRSAKPRPPERSAARRAEAAERRAASGAERFTNVSAASVAGKRELAGRPIGSRLLSLSLARPRPAACCAISRPALPRSLSSLSTTPSPGPPPLALRRSPPLQLHLRIYLHYRVEKSFLCS
eukprot:scaffold307583_cov32-Tisochrysis_lutea.AAC.1